MIVNSNNIEFGNELFAVLPYAYYQYKRGNLESTMSAEGTKSLYYFSPFHVINDSKRHWANIRHCKIPNVHVNHFTGKGEWLAPPYKETYENDFYVYDKPIYVIANKYNKEWGRDPVNYLNTEILLNIIEDLYYDYKIFYNRVIPVSLSDDQVKLDLDEHDYIRRVFPDVTFIHEIPGDYNLNQLMIYANCDRFISVQGGNSILASYFGGKNIIYAVSGNEMYGFYDKLDALSGCDILHVKTYEDILRYL